MFSKPVLLQNKNKGKVLLRILPPPPPRPPRHVTRLSLDSKAKSRFQTKASTSSRRLENIGFSSRYACVTRTKAKILNTNEIRLLHQKRKKRSCRYTSPQTKSTICQIFSTRTMQTQPRKKQKKKETPASQPATSQGIPSYLKTTKSIFHQKKKEIKKLSEISSCAD
jgi:hypothetical protein